MPWELITAAISPNNTRPTVVRWRMLWYCFSSGSHVMYLRIDSTYLCIYSNQFHNCHVVPFSLRVVRLKKLPGKRIFRICGASYLHLLPHQKSSFPLSTTFATTQSCIEGDHSRQSLVQRHHLKNANGKVPPSNMHFATDSKIQTKNIAAHHTMHLVDFSQALMAALKQYSSSTRSSIPAKSQSEASHLMACHYFKLTFSKCSKQPGPPPQFAFCSCGNTNKQLAKELIHDLLPEMKQRLS